MAISLHRPLTFQVLVIRQPPVDVRVDADAVLPTPRALHRQISHLGTDTGQLAQLLDRLGNVSPVPVDDDPGRLLQVDDLLPPEADGLDQLAEPIVGEAKQQQRRQSLALETFHRRRGDFVSRLGREHQRDEDLISARAKEEENSRVEAHSETGRKESKKTRKKARNQERKQERQEDDQNVQLCLNMTNLAWT